MCHSFTKDLDFVHSNYTTMEKEHDFWLKYRTTSVKRHGKVYHLAHYVVQNLEPRPEGYREDLQVAEDELPEEERVQVGHSAEKFLL